MADMPTPEALTVLFHETYERLAPQYGYETRTETRKFDPNSPNGTLMIAVCSVIHERILTATQEALTVAQDAMQYAINRLDADKDQIQVSGDLAVALAVSRSLHDAKEGDKNG